MHTQSLNAMRPRLNPRAYLMNPTPAVHAVPAPQPAMPAILNPSDLLTPEAAATLLGMSSRTLATWRSKRRHGLPYIRVGGRIRYSKTALLNWLQSRHQTGALPPQ